jgi:WD40 repeat protein
MSDPAPTTPVVADPAQTHFVKEFDVGRPIFGVTFDPQERFLVCGAQSNLITRFNLADGAKVELVGHDSWIRAFAFADAGETLLSGGYDGRILWWPLAAEAPVATRTIDAHQGWVRALAVSPDGTKLASCGNDNLVKLWSLADGSLLQTFAGHTRHVYNVAFHPTAQQLVSVDLLGAIKAWDLTTGMESKQFTGKALHSYDTTFRADMGGARGLAFSPDGKFFAACGITEVSNAFAGIGEPIVLLFDWEKPEPAKVMKTKAKFQGVAWDVAFHPAGYLTTWCSGGGGGELVFFQPEATEEFALFKAPKQGHDFDLSTDGLTAAVGHIDGKLRLYRLAAKV